MQRRSLLCDIEPSMYLRMYNIPATYLWARFMFRIHTLYFIYTILFAIHFDGFVCVTVATQRSMCFWVSELYEKLHLCFAESKITETVFILLAVQQKSNWKSDRLKVMLDSRPDYSFVASSVSTAFYLFDVCFCFSHPDYNYSFFNVRKQP